MWQNISFNFCACFEHVDIGGRLQKELWKRGLRLGKTEVSFVEAFQTCATRTGAPHLVIVKGPNEGNVILELFHVEPSASGNSLSIVEKDV